MDELKNGLKMDRLSCHRFMANFFRLILHTAAMNLLNAVRDDQSLPEVTARRPALHLANPPHQGRRGHRASTRRILVKLASNWPWWPLYQQSANAP